MNARHKIVHKLDTHFIYTQNISGGRTKIQSINDRIANMHYDVISLQETWFLSTITNEELIANIPFTVYRRDRCHFHNDATSGGGVAFYVRNTYTVTEIALQPRTKTEIMAISIENDTLSLILINVYVPPQQISTICPIEIATSYDLIRRISTKSPLRRGMLLYNQYRNLISMGESVLTRPLQ